jgi:CRISPR-associated protein Csy3
MSDNKVASVLSFERKLDPSDALFFAGNWAERDSSKQWQAIIVREKSVRGTISNRLKTKDADPAKLDAEIENANLQRVDVAALPNSCDTLKVCFTLRVLGEIGQPSACNNAAYREKLLKTVQSYVVNHGYSELANRYAYNLANGRFLWRNRMGAEQAEIRIHHKPAQGNQQSWCFNALDLSLRHFKPTDAAKAGLETLSQVIESGLNGERYVLLTIEAYVRVGEGQEVFPSQELILDQGGKKKGQKSKTLYQVEGVAAMHSQKIGNALRTIDTWYPDENAIGPIAVEPYGSVTSLGKAYRQPKEKQDFYNLFDKWVVHQQVPDVGNQHYVMATLIRGGVFGESGKE